jgi:hypothetical protein
MPFGQPKSWSSWANRLYSETEQAAYLARHYLESIYLGVEIVVWYKSMHGEDKCSLYYGEASGDPKSLRPMGHAYRNLANLLPENPRTLKNDRFDVSLVDLPDTVSAPDIKLRVRSYLRKSEDRQRLVIALWNPVEAFDGKILESRKQIGENFHETWRSIVPDDHVEVPLQVKIDGLEPSQVRQLSRIDLLATDVQGASTALEHQVGSGRSILSPVLEVGPVPTVLVVDLVTEEEAVKEVNGQ